MAQEPITEGATTSKALWRLPTVRQFTGLGRSSIYQLISQGKFPRQILYHGRAAWVSTEIENWIEKQISEDRRTKSPVKHNAK